MRCFLISIILLVCGFSIQTWADEDYQYDRQFTKLAVNNPSQFSISIQNYVAPETGMVTFFVTGAIEGSAQSTAAVELGIKVNNGSNQICDQQEFANKGPLGTSYPLLICQVSVNSGDIINLSITNMGSVKGYGNYAYYDWEGVAYIASSTIYKDLQQQMTHLTQTLSDNVKAEVTKATSTTNQTFINQISNDVNTTLTSAKIADGIATFRANQASDMKFDAGQYLISDIDVNNVLLAKQDGSFAPLSIATITADTTNNKSAIDCPINANSHSAYIDLSAPNGKNYLATLLEAVAGHQKVQLTLGKGSYDKDMSSGTNAYCKVTGLKTFAN